MVAERARHSIVYTLNGEIFTLIGSEAEAFAKKYLQADLSGKEFKGRVACRGKATGTVKVVLGVSDFSKLQKGDILVVANTSPDFVTIMRKASAILAQALLRKWPGRRTPAGKGELQLQLSYCVENFILHITSDERPVIFFCG